MRVLGLCSYPVEAAAARFRLGQFVGPLREHGIDLTISSFLDSGQFRSLYENKGFAGKALGLMRPVAGRIVETFAIRKYDLLFVQREAMLFGPGFFEWLYAKVGNIPMVLDLDDATYISYVSPTYGRLGSAFKFFRKTDNLIRNAEAVVCGNRFIAEHVESLGTRAVIVPTIVNTDVFCPAEIANEIPVIGWIGTHSTYPFLEWLFPVLERLALTHRFILRIVGAGRDDINVKGFEIDNRKWKLEREIEDFQTLDIGLYPLTLSDSANKEWLLGKSGFKAIQYMAVGVPFVMSPVGVGAEIGVPGETHLNAETLEDWYNSLNTLLSDAELRRKMGKYGREHSVQFYSVPVYAETLADVLYSTVDTLV